MMQTDEQLITDYQNGDVEAFEALFGRFKGPILNFAYRVLLNRADAEDVVADVFLTLLNKNHLYKPTGKFKTWLFTIAHHTCISKIRKDKRMTSMYVANADNEEDRGPIDVKDHQPLPNEVMEQKEEQERVQAAVAMLSHQYREALVLREFHELSYAEIAQICQCNLEQVKINIYRARNQLREILLNRSE